jgi:hypothetical protein
MSMRIFSKAVAFVLLSAVIVAPLTAQGLVASAGTQERSAGCHEDSGKVPAPAPNSHQCCQGSHHPAILQQPSAPRPSLEVLSLVAFVQHSVAVAASCSFANRVILSGDPPATSPLRV